MNRRLCGYFRGMGHNPREVAATTAARNYLERVGGDMDVEVEPIEGSDLFWKATVVAPHPMADDVDTRVIATGSGRDGALELVRVEMHSLAYRCALDPAAYAREVNERREGHLYAPGRRGNLRVKRAVVFHRGVPPEDAEVEQAALAARVRGGARTLTVGDVASEVLNRQAFPVIEGPQGALAV